MQILLNSITYITYLTYPSARVKTHQWPIFYIIKDVSIATCKLIMNDSTARKFQAVRGKIREV